MENRLLVETSKKKGSVPNHMPKQQSNLVKPEREIKQRIAGGRKNTTMRDSTGRLRTRADVNRREIEDQD